MGGAPSTATHTLRENYAEGRPTVWEPLGWEPAPKSRQELSEVEAALAALGAQVRSVSESPPKTQRGASAMIFAFCFAAFEFLWD